MQGTSPELFEGALGVENNRITLLSSDASRIEEFRSAADRVIDCSGRLLMPGLINTHCHVSMTLQRGLADDIELMTWLNDYVWPFEAKQNDDDIELGAELGIAEMLLGGVTSFIDMYWSEHRVAQVAERMGIRALLSECYLDGKMESFEQQLPLLIEATRGSSRVRGAIAPHAPYTCPPELIRRGVELSHEHNMPLNIHLSETTAEESIMAEKYGKSATQYLDELGALTSSTIVAHCVHLSDEDIATLSERGVSAAHNPQCNMKISSGVAPSTKMLSQGFNTCIGTDGVCSNNDLDMWEEMRTASFLQKLSTMSPLSLPAYEVLRMATVNGARALGMEGELGVLREGALADIIAVNISKPHFYPRHDIVSSLIYCAKAADVEMVMVDGEIRVENSTLLNVDVMDICERAEKRAFELAAK